MTDKGNAATAAFYGWDLGGAHLKLARLTAAGRILAVEQLATPLWQGLAVLQAALANIDLAPDAAGVTHAVTMSGELCDVFATRKEGVAAILAALGARLGEQPLRVFAGASGWLDLVSASGAHAEQVASCNWLVTAEWVATRTANAVLIDIGSTTTDIVPIQRGRVVAHGGGDAERLAADELVYGGVTRTPVMAVCDRAPFRGHWQGLAAEYFANMADVYRLTGELARDADLMATADGRGRDIDASARRLGRMLGRDVAGADAAMVEFARFIAHCQFDRLQRAFARVLSTIAGGRTAGPVIGAGVGRFLARRLAVYNGLEYIDFATLAEAEPALAEAAAVCAPAVAIAKLAWSLPGARA